MSNGLYYAMYFVGALLTYISFIVSLELTSEYRFIKSKENIVLFILMLIGNYIIEIGNFFIINNITMIVSLIIFIKLTSNLNIKKSVIAFIKLFLIIIVGEIIIGVITTFIIDINELNKYLLLFVRISGFLLVIILSALYNMSFYSKKKIMYVYVPWLFIISVICLLIIIGSLNYITTLNKNYNMYLLFALLVLFIVAGLRFIAYLIINNHDKNIEIKKLKDKNREAAKYIDEFKAYKHNLRYDLLAVKEYGNKKVNKEIDKLLNKNDNDLDYINNFKEIPSSLIHIFSDRLSINNNNNIHFIIKNSLVDKELIIKEKFFLEIYEVIGNCLTNAMEAIPENGVIFVDFYELDNNKYVTIVNNFNNSVDLEYIGKIKYSTKRRNSGFGLSTIFNSRISVEAKIINNMFEVKICIP